MTFRLWRCFKIKTMMIFTRISFKGLGNSYLIISIHISLPKVNTMLSHFRLCQDQTWAPIYASRRYHSHSWYHYHHRQFDDNDDSNVLGTKRRLRLKRISWKILGSINHSFKEIFQERAQSQSNVNQTQSHELGLECQAKICTI